MNQKITKYITKDGLAKLEKELEHRVNVLRTEIADKLDHAKSMGDLSENSAYHAALEEYQHNEVRIKDLKALISTLVIAEDKHNDDFVDIGDTVIVEDTTTKKQETYKIVGQGEGNPIENQVSTDSLIGGALVGQKVGATVMIALPNGAKKLKVIELK